MTGLKPGLLASVAVALFAGSAAEAAALFKFELTGDLSATWTASAVPQREFNGEAFFADYYTGTFNGQPDTEFYLEAYEIGTFGPTTYEGGIGILKDQNILVLGKGARIFEGTADSIRFLPGVYQLTPYVDFLVPGTGTLIITDLSAVVPEAAIPEPVSWALMIAGFGLVGSALRQRQVVAAA